MLRINVVMKTVILMMSTWLNLFPHVWNLLQAVSLITRYTRYNNNNAYLQKVDSIMASFAWQTRTIEVDNNTQTRSTSYFS